MNLLTTELFDWSREGDFFLGRDKDGDTRFTTMKLRQETEEQFQSRCEREKQDFEDSMRRWM